MGLKQSKKNLLNNYEFPKNGIRESRYSSGPIRIGILGDEKVGKTSICNSLMRIEFQTEYLSTIGIDKFEKNMFQKMGKKLN